MLSIFYNKTSLEDVLIININNHSITSNKTTDKYTLGYENNGLSFANIFNVSDDIQLPSGYLMLTKEMSDYVKKVCAFDISIFDKEAPFVVGKIITCANLNKTHLHLCRVDIGNSTLNIVCGAGNVRKDLNVVVARVGTVMPNGLYITPSKLMGYESEGMICSNRELGIIDRSFNKDGIIELNDRYKVGERFVKHYANCK